MAAPPALDRSLVLVLWAKDEGGEDDVAVFPGMLYERDGRYYLKRKPGKPEPEILAEWLPRIVPVPEDLRETLRGCDFQLSLTVGGIADGGGDLENFGLKWPE